MNPLKDTSRVFIGQVGTAAVGIIAMVGFTRLLGASTFGAFLLYEGIVVLIAMFGDIGLAGAVEKRISDKNTDSPISTALTVQIVICCIIFITLLLASEWINSYIGHDLSFLIGVGVFARMTGNTLSKALRGNQHIVEDSILELVRRIVYLLAGFILIHLGNEVVGLAIALILSWVVTIIWVIFRLSDQLTMPTKKDWHSLYRYARHYYISSVVGGQFYTWTDVLIIGYFLAPNLVTVYQIAWRISGMVGMFSKSIARILLPSISLYSSTQKEEKIKNIVEQSVTGVLLVPVPAVTGGLLVGDKLINYTFDISTAIGGYLLCILLIGKVVEGLEDVFGNVLKGIDRPDLVIPGTAISILILVSGNLLLVPVLGLIGAALSTTTAFGVKLLLELHYVRNLSLVKINWGNISHIFVSSLASTSVLLIILHYQEISNIYGLFGVIFMTVFAYVIALYLNEETREAMNRLIA